MLYEDAVVLRKPVFARAVPIEEIVAISAGRHGVMFAWADGNTSTSTGVGEQGILPNRLVPGPGLAHSRSARRVPYGPRSGVSDG